MNWMNIWIKLFGTSEFFGLDMGFWISMLVVTLLVVIMNVVFWCMKPKSKRKNSKHNVQDNLKM